MATRVSTSEIAAPLKQAAALEAAPLRGRGESVPGRDALERERRFYAIAAFAMLVITLIGFRQFVLHGKAIGGEPMTPQIVILVVAHGIAMLGWVVLFCVQSVMIVAGRRRLHVTLGLVGGVLAAAIVILGIAVAPLSVHYNPPAYDDFGGARYFLGLMWPEPVTFGILVGLALLYRDRPEVHRPMMLMGTLVLMTGPLDRFPYWEALVGFLKGSVAVAQFGQMLLVGGILFVIHAAVARRPSRYFAAGYVGIAAISMLSSIFAHSAAWNQIAGLVVR